MIRHFRNFLCKGVLCVCALLAVSSTIGFGQKQKRQAVVAKHGMVVCASPPAAEIGAEILKKGGNAVDATIAVCFVQAVTYPVAGNIGGGGFMLIHPLADRGQPTFLDYRETAPAKATATMFAERRDAFGHLSVGVPGTVRGLEYAFKNFGSKKIKWCELVQPAIQLADYGWPLEPWSAGSINRLLADSPNHSELQLAYGKPNGEKWQPGDVMRLPELAKVLRLIAESGAEGFYRGPVAELIAAEMQRGGGLITTSDLENYQVKERKPIRGTYRGYDVWSAPPPSSGGIALVEMLNILECFDLKKHGADSPSRWHITAEAMRRAFLDRARHLGDSDFVAIPLRLTDKQYAQTLAASIAGDKATSSESLAPDIKLANESPETTHISVVDADGMAVSQTYTLEHSYGSRVVVRGAGFILNNEMMDFNPVPGVTNRKGQIGTSANVVAPGKRMLSSMTPTIIAKGGRPFLITGSPGGRTIINTVLCVTTNVLDYGMDVQTAVDFPRLHHAWMPDMIRMERIGERPELVAAMKKLGHNVQSPLDSRFQGDAHSIWIDPKTGERHGAADGRIMGKAAGY